MSSDIQINDQEAELYDRQIRLWGVEAQNRLRNANVLIIGFDGVGVEAAKNIMLVGVRSLTIVDHRKIGDDSCLLDANFFIDSTESDDYIVTASETCCAKLNNNVQLKVLTSNPYELDEAIIKQSNFVLISGQPDEVLEHVSKITRQNHIPYMVAEAYGFYGSTFTDFGEKHAYICELKIEEGTITDDVVQNAGKISIESEQNSPAKIIAIDSQPEEKRRRTAEHHDIEVQQKHKIEEFQSFNDVFHCLMTDKAKEGARNIKDRRRKIPMALYIVRAMRLYVAEGLYTSHVDISKFEEIWAKVLAKNGLEPSNFGLLPCDFAWSLNGQLTMTCAIIGGIASQELIKGISLKDKPYNNTCVYDGCQNNTIVVKIPSNSA